MVPHLFVEQFDERLRVLLLIRVEDSSSEYSYRPQAFDYKAIERNAWRWLHHHRERGSVEFALAGRRRLHVEQHAVDATQTILYLALVLWLLCAHNSLEVRVEQVV